MLQLSLKFPFQINSTKNNNETSLNVRAVKADQLNRVKQGKRVMRKGASVNSKFCKMPKRNESGNLLMAKRGFDTLIEASSPLISINPGQILLSVERLAITANVVSPMKMKSREISLVLS